MQNHPCRCGNLCRTNKALSKIQDIQTERIHSADGEHLTVMHPVFPGIEFIYTAAHTQSVRLEESPESAAHIFEIIYCREGRLECSVNGEFWYLSPGDLAILPLSSLAGSHYFPLRHYHGITLRIDLSKTVNCLSCFLNEVTVCPQAVAEKFCNGGNGFITRANPAFEHLFSELYSVPSAIRQGYLKIKTLELLLYLSALDIQQDQQESHRCTRMQAELAKEIGRYLTEHMDDRITLHQLSERFHLSGTYIKNTFKSVYGVPLGAYIRTQKMESAAYMLEYTDKSILEIANEHGYDNGSKFSAAFRAVKGVNPTEYRSVNLKK